VYAGRDIVTSSLLPLPTFFPSPSTFRLLAPHLVTGESAVAGGGGGKRTRPSHIIPRLISFQVADSFRARTPLPSLLPIHNLSWRAAISSRRNAQTVHRPGRKWHRRATIRSAPSRTPPPPRNQSESHGRGWRILRATVSLDRVGPSVSDLCRLHFAPTNLVTSAHCPYTPQVSCKAVSFVCRATPRAGVFRRRRRR
jgi:hypothetical protein